MKITANGITSEHEHGGSADPPVVAPEALDGARLACPNRAASVASA